MEIPKLIILLCCISYSFASHEHDVHNIPIEGYESELQDLGQHVEIPETPVKLVKITKTIAVKIPVPYPVKVHQKVPYPVHVSKPYPVPVPQIIKVPHVITVQGKPTEHEAINTGHGINTFQPQYGHQQGNSYEVQEAPSQDISALGGHSFGAIPDNQSYEGFNSGYGQSFGQNNDDHSLGGSSYEAGPSNSYSAYGGDNEGHGSVESKSYDQAIKEYLNKHNPSGSAGNLHYH